VSPTPWRRDGSAAEPQPSDRHPPERRVWESHPHGSVLLLPALALPLLVGAGVAALVAVPPGGAQVASRVAVLLLVAVLLALAVVRPVLAWLGTRLVLTRGRVGVVEGVLSRRERDVPLSRVAEVRTVQTARERLLGTGTLVVVPVGDAPVLTARRVPRLLRVQALLLALAEEAGAGEPEGAARDGDDEPDGAGDEPDWPDDEPDRPDDEPDRSDDEPDEEPPRRSRWWS